MLGCRRPPRRCPIPVELTILIASYLEPEHVRRIEASVPGVRVAYEPDLLAPPRFPADHTGWPGFRRTPAQEARFLAHLAAADVLFDLDRRLAPRLPELAPRLRWIQATSSGIGPLVRQAGLDGSGIRLTNAAGIHAVPLAEHALLSLLYFVKEVPARRRDQRAHRWERTCGRELRGMTVGVVGLGAVGREIARVLRAVGMRVVGVRRTPVTDPAEQHADEVLTPDRLPELLARCDALVLIAPHTPETEGMSAPASSRGFRRARSWSTSAAAPWSTRTRSCAPCARATSAAPRSTWRPSSRCPRRARCGTCPTC